MTIPSTGKQIGRENEGFYPAGEISHFNQSNQGRSYSSQQDRTKPRQAGGFASLSHAASKREEENYFGDEDEDFEAALETLGDGEQAFCVACNTHFDSLLDPLASSGEFKNEEYSANNREMLDEERAFRSTNSGVASSVGRAGGSVKLRPVSVLRELLSFTMWSRALNVPPSKPTCIVHCSSLESSTLCSRLALTR